METICPQADDRQRSEAPHGRFVDVPKLPRERSLRARRSLGSRGRAPALLSPPPVVPRESERERIVMRRHHAVLFGLVVVGGAWGCNGGGGSSKNASTVGPGSSSPGPVTSGTPGPVTSG